MICSTLLNLITVLLVQVSLIFCLSSNWKCHNIYHSSLYLKGCIYQIKNLYTIVCIIYTTFSIFQMSKLRLGRLNLPKIFAVKATFFTFSICKNTSIPYTASSTRVLKATEWILWRNEGTLEHGFGINKSDPVLWNCCWRSILSLPAAFIKAF